MPKDRAKDVPKQTLQKQSTLRKSASNQKVAKASSPKKPRSHRKVTAGDRGLWGIPGHLGIQQDPSALCTKSSTQTPSVDTHSTWRPKLTMPAPLFQEWLATCGLSCYVLIATLREQKIRKGCVTTKQRNCGANLETCSVCVRLMSTPFTEMKKQERQSQFSRKMQISFSLGRCLSEIAS